VVAVGEHRLGLVGAGRIGRLHAENVTRIAGLTLVAVADEDPGAAEALAARVGCQAYSDWRQLVVRDELDAVLICSPPAAHAEQAAAAAEAGKHVFCEKPIADDLAAADRALAAVARAGTVLQVGYNRRFDRNFRAVHDAVAAGRVGTPCLVRITSRDPAPPPRDYLEISPGLFFDTTTHDLDLARFLLGAEIVEVSARGAALFSDDVCAVGGIDTAVTMAAFEGGALALIDNCWTSAYGYDQRVEVHGTEGLVGARNEVTDTTVVADAAGFHEPVLPYFFADRYAAAFRRELEAFAAALGGEPVPVTGRDGRQALAAATAAARSHDEGRAVALAELGA
jgi:myo-inositol 2-dehydrogenase / D-chiro-inositol 1-dehydrogenase